MNGLLGSAVSIEGKHRRSLLVGGSDSTGNLLVGDDSGGGKIGSGEAPPSKRAAAKAEYRQRHAHEVVVPPEQLQCIVKLPAEVQVRRAALAGAQGFEALRHGLRVVERRLRGSAPVPDRLSGYIWSSARLPCMLWPCPALQALIVAQRQQNQKQWRLLDPGSGDRTPPFMAHAASPSKRCHAADPGEEIPRLHRLALLGPATVQPQQPAEQQRRRNLRQEAVVPAGTGAGASEGPHLQLGAAGGQAAGSAPAAAAANEAADISLVTQVSLDRLPSLERQCAGWPGPLVAVAYAPLVEGRVAVLDSGGLEELASLNGSSPLAALEYVAVFHRSISGVQGEPAGGRVHTACLRPPSLACCSSGGSSAVLSAAACRLPNALLPLHAMLLQVGAP